MRKKLKILHIIDHLPDCHETWGGAEKSALRRINVLLDFGKHIETVVVATKPKKRVEGKFRFFRIWTFEDFFPKKFHLYITGLKNQILPFDLISFVSVFLLARKIKPDIIHLHKANKISFSPILVSWLLKIPLVLSIADYWYFCPAATLTDSEGNQCWRFQGKWCANCSATKKFFLVRKFAYFFRRPLFDFFLSKVSAFLVASNSNKDLLSSYGINKRRMVLVRQVYNNEVEKVKGKMRKNTIYLNAWMSAHKGVHVAVAAMEKVVKEIPEAQLFIETKVFDKDYEKKILEMIKGLNLQKNISISPKPSLKIYLKHLKEANVVLVPEQWENMGPTTLGDAMAMGKAIVASKIGGIPEIIKDGKNGLLANPQDSNDFGLKIIKLLKNQEFALKLGRKAAKDIRRIGSRRICFKNLLKLYQTARKNRG